MESQIEEITAIKVQIELDEAIEEAKLPIEADFDTSDEGKLLHRYEIDFERSMFRCVEKVGSLNAQDAKLAQVQPITMFCEKSNRHRSEANGIISATITKRNEPIVRDEDDPFANLTRASNKQRPMHPRPHHPEKAIQATAIVDSIGRKMVV